MAMIPAWKKGQLSGGNGTPVVDDRGAPMCEVDQVRLVAYGLRFRVTKRHVSPRPARQFLLPRCYRNTPYQEHHRSAQILGFLR